MSKKVFWRLGLTEPDAVRTIAVLNGITQNHRLTGVDRAESQAQQAIVVLVLDELLADPSGSLDCLVVSRHAANGDGVQVNIAAGRAAVTVGDAPGVPLHLRRIRRWVVDIMAAAL